MPKLAGFLCCQSSGNPGPRSRTSNRRRSPLDFMLMLTSPGFCGEAYFTALVTSSFTSRPRGIASSVGIITGGASYVRILVDAELLNFSQSSLRKSSRFRLRTSPVCHKRSCSCAMVNTRVSASPSAWRSSSDGELLLCTRSNPATIAKLFLTLWLTSCVYTCWYSRACRNCSSLARIASS